jgi:hypothetical protein
MIEFIDGVATSPHWHRFRVGGVKEWSERRVAPQAKTIEAFVNQCSKSGEGVQKK